MTVILAVQVPVVNSSSQVVYITASLQGGEAFSGHKDLMVAAGQTDNYPLTFCAPWVGDYAGTLSLNFIATGPPCYNTMEMTTGCTHTDPPQNISTAPEIISIAPRVISIAPWVISIACPHLAISA